MGMNYNRTYNAEQFLREFQKAGVHITPTILELIALCDVPQVRTYLFDNWPTSKSEFKKEIKKVNRQKNNELQHWWRSQRENG